MKRNIFFGLTVFATCIIVALFYLSRAQKSKYIPGQFTVPKSNIDEKKTVFHPDSVLKVEFQYQDKKFAYERKSNMTQWQPSNSIRVQELLNEVSFYGGESMKEIIKAESSLVLVFNDGQVWQAESDKESFIWTVGPYKGRGVSIPTLSILRVGKFLDKNKSIQFCPARLKAIKIKDFNKDGEWSLKQDKLNWSITRTLKKKTTTIMVDPNFIELWLGQHCDLEMEELLDPELMIQLGDASCKIDFTFEKAKKNVECFEIGNTKKIVFKLDDYLFQSKEFQDAITMLQNAPYGIEDKKQ